MHRFITLAAAGISLAACAASPGSIKPMSMGSAYSGYLLRVGARGACRCTDRARRHYTKPGDLACMARMRHIAYFDGPILRECLKLDVRRADRLTSDMIAILRREKGADRYDG